MALREEVNSNVLVRTLALLGSYHSDDDWTLYIDCPGQLGKEGDGLEHFSGIRDYVLRFNRKN